MSRWEQAGRWLFFATLLGVAPYVLQRNVRDISSDFAEFWAAGRYILEHGARQPDTILGFYWPSLDVAWAALAWMPLAVAAVVWYAIGCGAWIALLRAIGRYLLADLDESSRRRGLLFAGLLSLPLVVQHLCLGSFHLLMVWWMVAGLGGAVEGKAWKGGLLLGLAVWVKYLPLLGVAYLVWKRRWQPALIALATAVLLDVVLSVAALGPQAAWKWHQAWWSQQATSTSNRVLSDAAPQGEVRLRNESLGMLLRRTLTQLPCDTMSDRHRLILADLSAAQVKYVYYALIGLLGLGIVAASCRPADKTNPDAWSREIALITLATLWYTPVVSAYHNLAMTPALAVVLGGLQRRPLVAWLMAAGWLAALALIGWPTARGLNPMWWVSLALAATLVFGLRSATSAADRSATAAHLCLPTSMEAVGKI